MLKNEKDPGSPEITQVDQDQFRQHTEWYAAFLRNTGQKITQEYQTLFDLQVKFPYMRERLGADEFAFLFVGGGTGQSEAALVFDVAHNGKRSTRFFTGRDNLEGLTVDYVDPSAQMNKKFKERLHRFGLTQTLRSSEIRKFENPFYVPPDADLTLGFQMWYYVNGWQGVPSEQNPLVKFARTVHKKGGVAVLSVQSQDGDLFAVRGNQLPKIHGYNDLVAETVLEELKRLGLAFETSTARSVTEISSCFQDEEFKPTEEGKNILSFMLRTSWDKLPATQQQEVAEAVKRLVHKNEQDPYAFLHQDKKVLVFRDTYIYIPGDQPRLATK